MMSYLFLIYFWLAFGMRFNMKKDPLYLANMEWLIRQNTRVYPTNTRVSFKFKKSVSKSDMLVGHRLARILIGPLPRTTI